LNLGGRSHWGRDLSDGLRSRRLDGRWDLRWGFDRGRCDEGGDLWRQGFRRECRGLRCDDFLRHGHGGGDSIRSCRDRGYEAELFLEILSRDFVEGTRGHSRIRDAKILGFGKDHLALDAELLGNFINANGHS
jgi:hypothetical protein